MTRGVPLPRIHVTCRQCGKDFSMAGSFGKHYASRGTGERQFCTRACYMENKRAIFAAKPAPTFACAHCGRVQSYPLRKDGRGYVLKQQYCGRECASLGFKRSSDLPLHIKDRHGYLWHFSGGKGGKYTPQHRIVMETMIGRPLRKEETVHHKNGIRTDNRPENLELWSSRHGKGQRVEDKIAFAAEMIALYPEVAGRIGVTVPNDTTQFTAFTSQDEFLAYAEAA